MKLPCHVAGKPALIVGYMNGKKNKPMAIVVTEGKLQAVRFKDIDLAPAEPATPIPLRRKEA